MPSGSSELADPAVRRVERGERDAGDGGRQREGQVDDGVEHAAAGKVVADQHPGDDEAEDGVDRRGEKRSAEARRAAPRACAGRWRSARTPPSRATAVFRTSAGERDEDDQAEIRQREAERQPETRDDARLLEDVARRARDVAPGDGHASVTGRLVDLVEDAAVVEVLRLHLGPAAEERIVDRDELHLGEALQVLRIDRPRAWPGDSSSWR